MSDDKKKIVLTGAEFNNMFELISKKDGQPRSTTKKGDKIQVKENCIVVIKENNLYEFGKTLSQVQQGQIKQLKTQGMSLRKIAKQFKVSHTTINRVVKGTY